MARVNQFSLENLLMSVVGHLGLVAIMVTAAVVVINRAKLVAPDRIQIIEIDLDKVVVSGEETKLYNVGHVADKQPEETVAPVAKPSAEEKKLPEEQEKVEIEKPTLVEPEEDKKPEVEEPEEEPKDKKDSKTEKPEQKKVEDKPVAKKKRTVVRVNRETVSLNRTLTVSVVDALRVAMTRCWVIDTARPDVADIRAVAHLTMRKNGTVRDVWFESAARAETDAAFAYVLDTIKAAIQTCQPLRMLPENEFANWEKIQLTFYPSSGKVM
ncbi:MAG: hypothetical protein IJD52_03325 [Alphaproteobacteria bacterium]|nr:hypothetical protein [Alphaproteobacteria bacterium]